MKGKEGLQLVNFEEEEDRDRDAMRFLVLDNKNLFKYLFDRYSTGNSSGILKRKQDSVLL
jgi:hypothetical protein